MVIHYSTINQYETCPYQYKLRYVDGLETVPDCDPQNALIIGTALHRAMETDLETAIREYFLSYPVITDRHITESIKLEYLVPKLKKLVPEGIHEVNFKTDDYEGTIDLLVPITLTMEDKDDICSNCSKSDDCEFECSGQCPNGKYDGWYDIYDFKYSNNITNYMKSPQLHLYKYFFEKANPHKHIRKLFFVFVPKCNLRLKYKNKTNPKDETVYEFRKRVLEDLQSKEIQIKEVKYDADKVIEFLVQAKHCIEDTEFVKNPSRLCDWCQYQKFCEKGHDYMILPENKRRETSVNTKPDMWIYADSYVGKSTFIDQIDNLLFANTDGNTENISSPVVRIKDELEKNGRITNKVFAWENFLDLVSELEKKENDFEVIALDLIEDLYEHCRLYMYNKLGIEHEQDAGFGKGWDMVRTEFLSTIKRLKNLGYRIIYISKELKTEINLKNGAKITSYGPNMNDKVANVLAGTVTLTVRAFMNNRGRFLQLAKEENIFGGGRFNFVHDTCELSMKAFIEELKLAQTDKPIATTQETDMKRSRESSERVAKETTNDGAAKTEASESVDSSDVEEGTESETPKTRRRKRESLSEEDKEALGIVTPEEFEAKEEEKPKRRTRKKREE